MIMEWGNYRDMVVEEICCKICGKTYTYRFWIESRKYLHCKNCDSKLGKKQMKLKL